MSSTQTQGYESNYAILEKITESLNKDEIGIDHLVEKTREALDAARSCMEILNRQKGEFQKLETEFSQLLQPTPEEPAKPVPTATAPAPAAPADTGPPPQAPIDPEFFEDHVGEDDPF